MSGWHKKNIKNSDLSANFMISESFNFWIEMKKFAHGQLADVFPVLNSSLISLQNDHWNNDAEREEITGMRVWSLKWRKRLHSNYTQYMIVRVKSPSLNINSH